MNPPKEKLNDEQQGRKTSLMERIKLSYEACGKELNKPQLEVLDLMPLSEFPSLLEEMNQRTGEAVGEYCRKTIYDSRNKRIFDEQREFDARTGPVQFM